MTKEKKEKPKVLTKEDAEKIVKQMQLDKYITDRYKKEVKPQLKRIR